MNTRTICITTILIILSSPAIEAKPVIIGFNGNVDSATIDAYNITNYTHHHSINAISADIPESTIDKIKKNKKIRYIEDDAYVHISKKHPLHPSRSIGEYTGLMHQQHGRPPQEMAA